MIATVLTRGKCRRRNRRGSIRLVWGKGETRINIVQDATVRLTQAGTVVIGKGVCVVAGVVVERTVRTRAGIGIALVASTARRESTTTAGSGRRAARRVARTVRTEDGLI